MPEVIGFIIAAIFLVLSGKGARCWYEESKKKIEDRK